MAKHLIISFLLAATWSAAWAQQGVVKGRVFNRLNNESVPFASVVIQGTTTGTAALADGTYELTGLEPGIYNLEATFVGFRKLAVFEVQVTNARPAIVNFGLEEEAKKLDDVVVVASASFQQSVESPLSLRTIGPTEIKRTPGGNRDISKVVRSLPGVASVPSFRNDIIIRGGAPSENTFYLDDIQIPVINHFQTQGSSGGPVGIINVDLLQEVNFYSGAFPANRGNVLSSVFDFNLKDGRKDRWTANGVLGATDLGITLEGPVGDRSSLIFSARRSYLKFLFDLFNLPFLPVYTDFQLKYKIKIDDRNQVTVLGIGAVDDFSLNFDAPEKADTEEEREEAAYILNILPVSTQWNYAAGVKYEHFRPNGKTMFIVSRNVLNNESEKYRNNDASLPENLLQDYNSRETENRVRVEDYRVTGNWKFNYGINGKFSVYDTRDFTRLVTQEGATTRDYASRLNMFHYGAFAQVSRSFFDESLSMSLGLRADANDLHSGMSNPLEQFSPRLSASYKLSSVISLNFNTGVYYQLPAYTVLGFRDTAGVLVNKENDVDYIRNAQVVTGLSADLRQNTRLTLEGFYKHYDQYPFLLEDSISLANLGADFGVIGNAPVVSNSSGRSYGLELLLQQKLLKGFYGLLSYTWVRSEFEDKNGVLVPSAWDNRHLVSMTGGKTFGRNWELSLRWLFTGGGPYTPFNLTETLRRENWDIRPFGIPDYDRLNQERIQAFHQLDLRIDKKYYFPKWSLNVYFDVQNAYNFVTEFQDNIDVQRDASGMPVVNPENPDFYLPNFIPSTYGTVLPTLGIIVEL